ncbi:hypothetical protein [Corynebacterium sp. HS2168-gen11]|uniref:hypothetical protein n=1 Tax=Corynebacterium sp. HS2168-gen11 TaxID=2974027 RepID=UPI00216B2671|nr:hypothetical protein [Corynebacterium sp. HS2168-gen11]MCS4536153.1 hypothetical protein [Corynebacterium sp. HS2168-gen11]
MTNLKLVGVYNANGGLNGELAYLKGKLSGTTHCALCDITHGYNPLGKRSWKQAAACSNVPISTVHLNEMDARTAAVMATTTAPAIVLLADAGDRVFITSEELETCDKDPNALLTLINTKLQQDTETP